MDNVTNSYTKLNVPKDIVRHLLESGPLFVNKTEQIVLTLYVFLLLILSYGMHGIFMGMIFYYRQFHTPYFAILFYQSIYEMITCATMCITIIYISLSGSNPFRGNTPNCLIHRLLTYSAVYASIHNLCVLSIDRVLFFYRPLWYQRVMTLRVIAAVEAVLFLFALCFNSIVATLGWMYFSSTFFLCFILSHKSVPVVEHTVYYGVNVVVIFSAMVMLQRLIVKQRRAIANQMVLDGGRNREEGRSVGDGIQEDRAEPPREIGIVLASGSGETGLANRAISGNNFQADQVNEINIANIKKGLRVIGSMSGVFWLGFFPSLTALLVLYTMKYKIIHNDNIVKDIIIRRLFSFYPLLTWIINPFIYIYANPAMRKAVARFFGRIRSRN